MLRLSETALLTRTVNRMVRDLLDVFILYTVNGGSRSGYDVKKTLGKLFAVKISYGSLYPHLHSLERSGLIVGEWVPHAKANSLKKKQYSLTELGRASLQANVEALSRISLTLQLELAGVKREIVAREIAPQPLNSLVSLLRSTGYKVESNVSLEGKSGAQHEVDVFAVKRDGDFERRLLFGISLADSPIGIGEVTRLYTQGFDLGSTVTVLITVPGLTEDAKRLASLYGMKVIETASVSELIEGRVLGLDELLVH